MLRYRATPLSCGKSPAELYLQRRLHIRLDAIRPNSKFMEQSNPISNPVRSFNVGERVQVRVHVNNQDIWQFGFIDAKFGQRHYLVILDSGRKLKRHIDQLRSSLVPKKTVSFAQIPDDHFPNQASSSRILGVPNVPPLQGLHSRVPILPAPETIVTPEARPAVEETPIPDQPFQVESVLRRSSRQRRIPAYLDDYSH